MSPLPPATGSAALNVPATREEPLRQDALGGAAAALPTMSLGTEKEAARLVLVGVWSTKTDGTATLYFAEVYSGTSDHIEYSSNAQDFANILSYYSSIDHLVVLSHSYGEDVMYSKTPKQLTELLGPIMPKVRVLSLDGCSAGKVPEPLFDMAVALGIGEIQAWTYFHHLQVWGRPAKNTDPNEDLAAVLDFASPYVPRGSSGATIPASQMQGWMDSQKSFSVVTEFFTYNFKDDLRFETLTNRVTHPGPTGPPLPEPWTKVRTPSEAEYPRSAVEDLVIRSKADAAAATPVINATEAPPYRIIIRP
jgi:hypothetical protein